MIKSYSQSGEDSIIKFIFDTLFYTKNPITYLDLGAYDPIKISNTYLFYELGGSGILVEPNPEIKDKFLKLRPKDKLYSVGVGISEGELTYYKLSSSTLNTFDKSEVDKLLASKEQKLIGTESIKILTIPEILKDCTAPFDFWNIDIETDVKELLQSIDLKNYPLKPKVLCVETKEYQGNFYEVKNKDLIEFIKSQGYEVYADTFLNTIFVNKEFIK